MSTKRLFDRYYFSRPEFVNGTVAFHEMCRAAIPGRQPILEIGAGPQNATTAFLAGLGPVVGLDVSAEITSNPNLKEAKVYDGVEMPFADVSFDACVSNYVLEHVADPTLHFSEVFRVLKPGGAYCFRTPNRMHYVALASSLLPHSVHLRIANRLRALKDDAHDPWPTVYRANTRGQLTRLALQASFGVETLRMFESEPSYGAAHAATFYPMMMYERAVNSTSALQSFRANIFGVFRKPLYSQRGSVGSTSRNFRARDRSSDHFRNWQALSRCGARKGIRESRGKASTDQIDVRE